MMGYAFLRDDEVELANAEDADRALGGGNARSSAAAAEQSLAEILSLGGHAQTNMCRADDPAERGEQVEQSHGEASDAQTEPAGQTGETGKTGEPGGDGAAHSPKSDWRSGARAYNAAHASLVEEFNTLTHGECGSGGDADPEAVARWQQQHGVAPDGRVGPRTFHAARRLSVAQTAKTTKAVATGGTGATPETGGGASEAGAKSAPVTKTISAPPKTHAEAAPVKTGASGDQVAPPKPDDAAIAVQLRAHYASIVKQYTLGQVSEPEAVGKLLAFDKKLHDGSPSMTGLVMVPFLLADLVKVAMAKTSKTSGGGGTTSGAAGTTSGAAGTTSGAAGTTGAGATVVSHDKPVATGEPFSHVYTAGSGKHQQPCQVYVSPGGVTATPDVFLFFHGHRAQYNIDGNQRGKGEISGLDVAADAMTHARGKNTIAILPQGKLGSGAVNGDRTTEGGYMAALQDGLPSFVSSVLTPLAADLHMDGLTPRHISLAGHSAGGYMGVHDALSKAGNLADVITDVTLMDTGYSTTHFADTAKWMYKGSPGKSVRIIGSAAQIKRDTHKGSFGPTALADGAKAHGFTVEDGGGAGSHRDADTTVVQHSKIMKDGVVHCDVLIMKFDHTHNAVADHAPLRDRVMDDSILSIGQGAAGSDSFGLRDHGNEPGAASGGAGEHHDAATPPKATPQPKPVHTESKPKDPTATKGHDEHVKEATKHAEPHGAAHPAKAHSKKHAYDSDHGVDSFGNLSQRGDDLRGQKSHATTFATPFTVVQDGMLHNWRHNELKKQLPVGTQVYVKDMNLNWVKIATQDPAMPISEEDNLWIKFSSLGGHGHDRGFGNERHDATDKARADKIREGLPTAGREPGKSPHKWMFDKSFIPSFDGVSLSGSLMSKVQALMEWAIANDMVLGNIVIGSGMRSPAAAHYLCVRYEIANMESNKRVTLEALKALPNGRDADGHKWYEPGWTAEQAIQHAKDLMKKEGASGKVAAAGYNFGNAKRAPLPISGAPGVSNHCSGHAVDVDIPWRSPDDPHKVDLWAWEQIYHQFGLTRPLHRDRGGSAKTQESWHIEETGKELLAEGEAEGRPGA
jgi:hypothetical protein